MLGLLPSAGEEQQSRRKKKKRKNKKKGEEEEEEEGRKAGALRQPSPKSQASSIRIHVRQRAVSHEWARH